MLAEIMIFVPSVARFRADFISAKLEKAQIASLSVLASENAQISPELIRELVESAEVYNVILRRADASQLILSSPVPGPVTTMVDLRDPSAWYLIRGAMTQLLGPREGVIRAVGAPSQVTSTSIEVAMPQAPLYDEMVDYGLRILALSLIISIIAAVLLFLAVRVFMVRPITRVVDYMTAYSRAPEDVRHIIEPQERIREVRAAEDALAGMQRQLTGSLKQKERLAQLGGAVAKISHDLRNILTTATLLADRMERSEDPTVQRTAPKLVSSLSRAVNLCETTLAFGKAEEAPPRLSRVPLAMLVNDVLESEKLSGDINVTYVDDVPPGMSIRADNEQIFRVLSNLVRNARQAIEATGQHGTITVKAQEDEAAWEILVCDNGPGLPPKAQENLFQAFEGGVRKGGTGLGLVIAADLIRGHGGALRLLNTSEQGTEFAITLPKGAAALGQAAE